MLSFWFEIFGMIENSMRKNVTNIVLKWGFSVAACVRYDSVKMTVMNAIAFICAAIYVPNGKLCEYLFTFFFFNENYLDR